MVYTVFGSTKIIWEAKAEVENKNPTDPSDHIKCKAFRTREYHQLAFLNAPAHMGPFVITHPEISRLCDL